MVALRRRLALVGVDVGDVDVDHRRRRTDMAGAEQAAVLFAGPTDHDDACSEPKPCQRAGGVLHSCLTKFGEPEHTGEVFEGGSLVVIGEPWVDRRGLKPPARLGSIVAANSPRCLARTAASTASSDRTSSGRSRHRASSSSSVIASRPSARRSCHGYAVVRGEARPDGPHREVQRRCDLFLAELLPRIQQQHLAVGVRKRSHRVDHTLEQPCVLHRRDGQVRRISQVGRSLRGDRGRRPEP